MNVELISDTEDMRKKMLEMVSKCEELQILLNDTSMKIEDSKGSFDTPTSLYFRNTAVSYITDQRMNISNQLVPFIEILDKIIDSLEEEWEIEKKMLNEAKGDKND